MKDKQKSENNINNLTRDLYLIKNKFQRTITGINLKQNLKNKLKRLKQ